MIKKRKHFLVWQKFDSPKSTLRDIKIDIVNGKYKAISAYKIPDDFDQWLNCPNCGLKPLVWEFNNGRSTACGCGENEYRNFSIVSESIFEKIGIIGLKHGKS